MKHFLKYWAPLIIWVSMIFYLSSVSDLKTDIPDTWEFIFRKIAHIGEYGILAILLLRLGESRYPAGWPILAGTLIGVLLYAASDEWHQTFVPGRTGAMLDVAIDFTGGIAGSITYYLFKR